MSRLVGIKSKMLSILVMVSIAPLVIALEISDNCDAVKAYFEEEKFNFRSTWPKSPITSSGLNMCEGSYTCCTTEMEDQLTTQSTINFSERLLLKTKNITALFQFHHEKFDTFFQKLIESAKQSLDRLFVDTYGPLYNENSEVFMKFFEDLKLYYKGGIVDLTDIFDSFFTTLLQRVFKLLNLSYDIDDDYSQCIGDNMNVVKPFADFPQKLLNQVQRSFIAARIFVQALKEGEKVSQHLAQIYPTTTCAKELMKMAHCSKCVTGKDIKPCKNTCVNTMENCMCELNSNVHDVWKKYLDAMMSILDRLDGPFDIEATLSPIDVKISEAVMMLQDYKDDIKDSVFEQCGVLAKRNFSSEGMKIDLSGLAIAFEGLENFGPKLSKRLIDSEKENDGGRFKRSSRNRKNKRHGHRIRDVSSSKKKKANKRVSKNKKRPIRLKDLVTDMRNSYKMAENFWKKLPRTMCEDVFEQIPEESCWNGTSNSINTKGGVSSKQRCNAEIYGDSSKIPDLAMRQQMVVLREISEKMWQAYRGVDPAFIDQELPTDNILNENFSGGGSGDVDEPGKESYWNDMKPNSSPKDKKLKHFSDHVIKLIETALGKKIARNSEWKELKSTLKEHPQLSSGKSGKTQSDIVFGDLKKKDLRQLKKILGMPHEPRVDGNGDVDILVTQRSNINIDTTSKGHNMTFSPVLTAILLATVHWVYKAK